MAEMRALSEELPDCSPRTSVHRLQFLGVDYKLSLFAGRQDALSCVAWLRADQPLGQQRPRKIVPPVVRRSANDRPAMHLQREESQCPRCYGLRLWRYPS